MKLWRRKGALIVTDAVIVCLSFWFATLVQHDFIISDISQTTMMFCLALVVTLTWFHFFNLYTILWEYASAIELQLTMVATGVSFVTMIVLCLIFHLRFDSFVLLFSFLMIMTFSCWLRLFIRAKYELKYPRSDKNTDRKRVMIVGAGEAGAQVLRDLQTVLQAKYVPIIVVDDDPTKADQSIKGIRIFMGINKIPEYASRFMIDEIIIAIPSASTETISAIVEVCSITNCSIKTIPGLEAFLEGKIHYNLVPHSSNDSQPDKIWLASPHMSDEGFEIHYVQEAFDSNWITSMGRNVSEFEREISQKVGIRYAVAMVSGTSAIHMAVKAAGVGSGDVVFCQDLTFSASANPIIYQNATPVFIDSDVSTWNMDPDQLELAFQKYPNAKAVICVHLFGLACDMDRICEICKKHHAILIEDAAESLGTTYKGKYTGTFGDYGIYSFNGNKIITTSGGGMLVTNHQDQSLKINSWVTQSRDQARYYQHSELGFNYHMSNIIAGIGRGQLRVLDQRIEKKRNIFEYYRKELEHLDGLHFMPDHPWNRPNFWLTCITVSGKIKPIHIIEALERENIEARHLWKPMHLQPFFQAYDFVGSGVSERLFETGVCLPSDTKMSDADLKRICDIIKDLWVKMNNQS